MSDERMTLNVWIVDDEPGMCMGTERALRDCVLRYEDIDETVDFVIETFGTGEDFLDRLPTVSPDILLLDNKLPGIEGVQVLEQLRESESKILVIMITAYATLEKAVKATKLGAYDFLAKPFTPNELKYSLRKATRNLILTRKAEELEAEKRRVRFEFISVLAHELKSPLNAIEGYTDLVKNKRVGDELAPYLPMMDRIDVRIGGMRKLIADLLDMTSIESGRKLRVLKHVDLADVATQVIENNSELATRNHVAVSCEIEGPIIFESDVGEMEMLFNNFISNAIKYNRPDGTVTVGAVRHDDRIVLTFRDTGIGMTEADQACLFKEFSRIKNSKTRDVEGSGLGLSIIKKILDLYHGTVDVVSEPDVGSTFTINLPVA